VEAWREGRKKERKTERKEGRKEERKKKRKKGPKGIRHILSDVIAISKRTKELQ